MWAFSNYSVVQRIILFQSGTPHKMLMVTSLWHVRVPVLHPCGLVPNFWRLWCQFRGGWSQPMANLTSEFDSNTFAGKETQHHLLYFFFFQSHYGRESRLSESTSACVAWRASKYSRGAYPFYYLLLVFVNFPFVTRHWEWLLWRKVTKRICGSFILYNYEGQFNEFSILWFCGSVAL